MWTTFTQKVRKAFTDSAKQYDILTSLHKEIGRELVKKTLKLDAQVIVDVGCGTGYAANKAKFFYPDSTIIGLDIAEGMLVKAQELHEGIAIDWIQADAQYLPFKNNSVDLLLSNLAYQWAADLNKAFAEAYRSLKQKGVLNITLFGGRTCHELFDALLSTNKEFKYRIIPTVDDVRTAMSQAGFDDIKVDFELIKIEFGSIHDLLGWLRDIGANNMGDNKQFLGKDMLARANEHYRRIHSYNQGICASFEVIWAYGRKK